MNEDPKQSGINRREFVAATAALVTVSTASGQAQVVEKNVDIKTPDGTCDAAFIHPATGAHAGVLIWTDIFGLRPAVRDLAKRLAAEGYSVLAPNPFYRVAKSPIVQSAKELNMNSPEGRAKVTPLAASINAVGAAERDAAAFVTWLDQQPQVDKSKKIGTQGYCMGGPLIMKTAAAVPDRIGAAASFHGAGLTSQAPTSPHLLIPKMKARLYFGVASNDDAQQPDSKNILRAAFDAAKVPAEIEVYAGLHGWCMPDSNQYHQADAEKAWSKLLALYKVALA